MSLAPIAPDDPDLGSPPGITHANCVDCGTPIMGTIIGDHRGFHHPAEDCPAEWERRRAAQRRFAGRDLAAELQSLTSRSSEMLRLRVREAIEGVNPSKQKSTADAMAAAAVGVFVDWLKNPTSEVVAR